jgi:pyruvate/2-oxoglutarate/acetoin dehydrogenase E1 component
MSQENELLYGTEFPVSAAALDKNWTVPLGKAKCERVGEDLTIITFSKCVGLALEAAKELEVEHGISVEVINLRTLRPLDRSAIAESIKKTGRLMTVEEGWPSVRTHSLGTRWRPRRLPAWCPRRRLSRLAASLAQEHRSRHPVVSWPPQEFEQ